MESTLYLQFNSNFGGVITLSIPSPDRDSPNFIENVIGVMDYIIGLNIYRTSKGDYITSKRRAYIKDESIEELDLNIS